MKPNDLCTWCEEPLDHDPELRAAFPYLRMHRECMTRALVGSVAHQRGTCSCFGGVDEDDLESMNRRQSARAASAEANRRSN